MKVLKILLGIICGIAVVIVIFVIAAWIFEYRPKDAEVLHTSERPVTLPTDTIRILSWNTGYGGLDGEMDFFYDGGSLTRTSRKNTEANIKAIAEFISSSDADIILLQEVDVASHRSYNINEFEEYKSVMPEYHAELAYNYRSFFVPIPLKNPIGKVNGGVAVFSRWEPGKVIRYQYPGGFPFPVRLFNLKRCMLSMEFTTPSGKSLMVNNTHNSAYDDGHLKDVELHFMRDLLIGWSKTGGISITGGDWNQNPPGYIQSEPETNDPYFSPALINENIFPAGWSFCYDPTTASARYLYESYKSGKTTTTFIDLFLLSPDIECVEIKTHDLGFANSDHNPVSAIFVVK